MKATGVLTPLRIWSTGVLKAIIRNNKNLRLLSASAVVLENNERYTICLISAIFSALKAGTLPLLSGSFFSV